MLVLVGAKSSVRAEGGKSVEQLRQNGLELKWKSSRLLRLRRPMWRVLHTATIEPMVVKQPQYSLWQNSSCRTENFLLCYCVSNECQQLKQSLKSAEKTVLKNLSKNRVGYQKVIE